MGKLIKTILLGACFSLLGAAVSYAAGERQTSSDFTTVAASGTVSVSNSAWTSVPTTGTIDTSRWAIVVTNPATNNANMRWRVTNDDNRPVSTSVGHELSVGQTIIISISGYMRLWLFSQHSGAENAFYEEWK